MDSFQKHLAKVRAITLHAVIDNISQGIDHFLGYLWLYAGCNYIVLVTAENHIDVAIDMVHLRRKVLGIVILSLLNRHLLLTASNRTNLTVFINRCPITSIDNFIRPTNRSHLSSSSLIPPAYSCLLPLSSLLSPPPYKGHIEGDHVSLRPAIPRPHSLSLSRALI